MQEVFFVIGDNDVVLWSDASTSPVYLPDSRARWEAIWSRRAALIEIAHSHPVGPLGFSREDETTMNALISAMGRPIVFSVIAPNGMVRRFLSPTGEPEDDEIVPGDSEPWWTGLLRLASGMDKLDGSPKQAPKSTKKPRTRTRRPARKDLTKEK